MTSSKDIADILFDEKKIDKDQLSAIKIESVNTGKSIEQIIKDRDIVTEVDILKAKSTIYGFEYVDPTLSAIPGEVLDLVSEQVAK